MRKNLLFVTLIVPLVLCVFGVNMNVSSAVEYPAIYIDPAETWNTSLTPGMNYTISICTNYTGADIWLYQFSLSYNPNVLHGGINHTDTWTYSGGPPMWWTTHSPIVPDSERVYVNGALQTKDVDYLISYSFGLIQLQYTPALDSEVKATYLYGGVVNGDLITTAKHPNATYLPGEFNNTLGKLDLTGAYFLYDTLPPPTTSGPGILANVTFTVVGDGFSDLTLGDTTKLKVYDAGFKDKIDAATMPDHIQHGFFCNIAPTHDVAVVSLNVPTSAAVEQPVPISVTVANEGTYDESVTLTVYNQTLFDSTVIDSTVFTLEKGLNDTVHFSWDTSGVSAGTYTINATATIAVDNDLSDNVDTKTILLQILHDVAVVSLNVPTSAAVEQPVPISVTVANEGTYDESVTLTVYNQTLVDSTVINSTVFVLGKGPTSKTVDFSWDTSGVSAGTYTINATATIAVDNDLSDNVDTKTILLQILHDVAVVSLDVYGAGTIGHLVPINVTVANEGSYSESVTLTVYNQTLFDSTVINSTVFVLGKGPTSKTVSLHWNTSGLAEGTYTINATATIAVDNDPSDNTKTAPITLTLIHNVRVVSVTAPPRDDVNHNVNITVTVENTGSYTETFNLTAYYDDTAAVLLNGNNYTTVTLACAESKTILMTWNTTGVVHGTYTIKANATIVAGETNTNDNERVDGTVLVTFAGDVDGDGSVDWQDFGKFATAYGSKGPPQKDPADPNYNPLADFDQDGDVDWLDFGKLASNYGK